MINLQITYKMQNGILKASKEQFDQQIKNNSKGTAKIEVPRELLELGFRKQIKPFQGLISVDGIKKVAVIIPSYLG